MALTGLPCPTTGGVRSLLAMLRGQWHEAFLYNPFTPVFLLLLLGSLYRVFRCLRQGKSVLLPPWLGWAWLIALALAWIAKFVIGPQYW